MPLLALFQDAIVEQHQLYAARGTLGAAMSFCLLTDGGTHFLEGETVDLYDYRRDVRVGSAS